MEYIHDYLKKLFKKNNNYMGKDGDLLISKIAQDARLYNSELIKFLLNDKRCKDCFFEKIDDVTIFKSEDFRMCINDARFLGNSFTKYGNKIGLITDKTVEKIMNEDYVVLSYPYKDCTLDGGMTKTEAKRTNRKETMINNILFKEDIHKLKSPKAFKNFKKYTFENEKVKEEIPTAIKGNENIIINGNNFVALCSLKAKFAGKIKLIYIDPPYNTGSDTFSYNDNFNHSTWLVFMKDRLQLARELLSDDGAIFVQCDDNEQAYLKVLMDEIFGRDNFINSIVISMSNMSGTKVRHAYTGKRFPKIKEYVLLFVKSKDFYHLNVPKENKETWDKEYNYIIPNITREEYLELRDFIVNNELEKAKKIVATLKLCTLNEYSNINNIKIDDNFKFDNMWRIVGTKPNESILKICKQNNINKLSSKQDMTCVESSQGNISIVKTDFNMDTETARVVVLFAEDKSSMFFSDLWTDITTTGGIAQEGDVSFPKGKKPEKLISRIIETVTNENDIVLDFFAGSGTTLAVAHKMNRRYIGVEQIQEHFDICVERLKKVIEGENSGISKNVNWQGGGEFITFDIASYNTDWDKKIEKIKDDKELKEIFEYMKDKSLINHRLQIDYFENKSFEDDKEFLSLDLERKKEILLELLDKNMFYVPFSEMKDKTFKLSDDDIKLSKQFYKN